MEKGNGVMRIAVTYKDGEVFQHFGHSEQFKLYDTEGEKITGEQIVDTNGSGHGALAGFLQAARVDALICGGIGMGARMALADVGIRETIEHCIDSGEAYRIMAGDNKAGGVVIKVNGERGNLELLFISPKEHSKGIGFAAWCAVEKLHPEVKIWETMTPYFEKRNIHFYVNRCRFHIVEFFNKYHPDPEDSDAGNELDDQFPDGMFRFEKIVK